MADNPASSSRDAVIDRYSGLARTALAGGAIADCEPGGFADGGFGAAAYTGTTGAPQEALRASLSTDKPRVLAEAFRVLRPGGRLGVSDIVADEGADPALLADTELWAGCLNGTLTRRQYVELLQAAGFTAITITPTHEAGPGLHSAIIQAAKPVTQHP